MAAFALAFVATAAIFIVRWFRRQLRQDAALQPLRQQAALEVLRERHGGPVSSVDLCLAVEGRVPGAIGFGTWFRLMDRLVDQGAARKVWRDREPGAPRWFGYELA